MTPSQLSAVLNRQAESVCKFLLPNGKRVHHEWMAGDTGGSAGRSLKIVLDGDKIGVWSDFHTGEVGGDLLDLWRVVMATGLYEAMQQAASWAGVQMDGLESRPQRSYKRPERPKNARRLNPTGKVMTYLKSRLLDEQTLEDFQIAEQDDEVVVFPYKRDGVHLNTKYLHIERPDGKKKCWQESGTEPTLFGWQALERRYPFTRIVALTEGEFDTCTLHQYGIPSLSIPNGGGGGKKQDWVENDYDYLNRFDTIYLCMDNDDAGREAEKEIIRRLGSERCKTVTLPFKDANECLMQGMTNFNKFFLQAKTFDPIELKPADYFTEELIESFYPKPGTYQGMKTPWSSFNQAMVFKRSELVVWSGYSGSGKSQMLGQVAIEGMSQGERFVICSLEMPSKETLKRMAKQLTAERCPTEARLREATAWMKDKLWMFNVVGKMKTERILEVFKYAVKRYDIRNFILDSLTKCNIREDDYEGQKEFVDALCDFNHRYEATTHLVVHQRKPSSNAERPDKFGARGAAAITDEASSVICVYRPSEPDEEEDTRFKKKSTKKDHNGVPVDSVLYIDKNRETGVEGKFNLFFDQDSLQFRESHTTIPIDYLTRAKTNYRSDDDGTF